MTNTPLWISIDAMHEPPFLLPVAEIRMYVYGLFHRNVS